MGYSIGSTLSISSADRATARPAGAMAACPVPVRRTAAGRLEALAREQLVAPAEALRSRRAARVGPAERSFSALAAVPCREPGPAVRRTAVREPLVATARTPER